MITQNSLTDQKLLPVLASIPKNLKYLDISGNPALTIDAYRSLCRLIDQKTSLLSLGLEDCKTGDEPVKLLCETLSTNPQITELKLAKNRITNVGALALANLLKRSNTLRVLLLHWNEITQKGGIAIGEALERNTGLMVLDLSFNNLGSDPTNETTRQKIEEIEMIKEIK